MFMETALVSRLVGSGLACWPRRTKEEERNRSGVEAHSFVAAEIGESA